jgi:methyl-accepting chemotaxis protein
VLDASNSSLSNFDDQSTRTNSVAAAINQLAPPPEIAHNASDASQQASAARRSRPRTVARWWSAPLK